jgi:vitamin B12 transporter
MNYYVGSSYEQTDNDSPNQHFDQSSAALRVEGQIDPVWTLGTTFRANDSYYENLGNSDDHLDASLTTLYATGKFSDVWTGRFLAGYHQEFYDSDYSGGTYGSDLRDASVSIDQEIKLSDDVRLLAGAYGHRSNYESTIGADEERDRFGVHSALEWDATDKLTATAALRWEDYEAYGDEVTWRLGAIQELVPSTSIRGGIGTSFRSPTYLDLFGSSFGVGNPNLEAETATGWDIGITNKILGHQLEATWFENHIQDQIQSFPTPPVNLAGETRTNGIEFAVRGAALEEAVSYRVAWTWLHESLSDQPRNAATASLDWKATEKSLLGIGATHLASHSWGGDPIDAYTVARFYGSYQVTEKVKLHARVENAFDADYELSNFYGDPIKGTGAGFYAGVTIDW